MAQIGICTSIQYCELAREAGFDYIELPLAATLTPSDKQVEADNSILAHLSDLPLPVRAYNLFIGKEVPFVGPNVNTQALLDYVNTAMRRAKLSGAQSVGIGSAGARHVPDGFSRDQARVQIEDFFRTVADAAATYNISATIEFLRPNESNVLNTAYEAAGVVAAVSRPHLGILADSYHLDYDEPNYSDLKSNFADVKHVHIASETARTIPLVGDFEFLTRYFKVVRQHGYDGLISVEGSTDGLIDRLTESREVIQAAWNASV